MATRSTDLSIRTQLLVWLAVPLCAVWVIATTLTFIDTNDAAEKIYDAQLVDSADSVFMRVDLHNGKASIQIPDSILAMLERNGQDKFFYEVRDLNGNLISQNEHLPAPSFVPPFNEPYFSNSVIQGLPVRVATIALRDPETHEPIVLQVAETLNTRKKLTERVLLNSVLPDLVLIILGSVAVYFGVMQGLSPLRQVQQAIGQRSSADLRAVPEEHVPEEVLPLIRAINDLLARLRVEIESQKRFVANAAHHIRTPLAGLKTYVGLARRHAKEADVVSLLQQLDEGTDRLTHLVNRLLSMAKAEPSERNVPSHQAVDLNDVVSTATTEIVPQALKKDIELVFEPCPTPAVISGNAESLTELVMNIVENAVVYTQPGGTVQVEVSNSDGVNLTVRDNGPGIPEDERERVFERFYRVLGNEATGSGLGLAIVKEIASAHNASVTLSPAEGEHGTVVRVHFDELKEG